jgi:hypothetical protein
MPVKRSRHQGHPGGQRRPSASLPPFDRGGMRSLVLPAGGGKDGINWTALLSSQVSWGMQELGTDWIRVCANIADAAWADSDLRAEQRRLMAERCRVAWLCASASRRWPGRHGQPLFPAPHAGAVAGILAGGCALAIGDADTYRALDASGRRHTTLHRGCRCLKSWR